MNTAKTVGEQMEERSFHTGGVVGSNPTAPTNQVLENTSANNPAEGVNAGSAEPGATLTDRYGAGVDNAEVSTHRHIARVRQLLGEAACQLIRRGDVHDASKFDPVELGPLQAMQEVIAREGQAPYGSDEYKRRTAMLGPMIAHHHEHNSHHPEHYPNGIAGMDLFDLIEMFFDWKAASERGGESTIGLAHSIKRFGISPQLASILQNTADRLGYRTDAPTPPHGEEG